MTIEGVLIMIGSIIAGWWIMVLIQRARMKPAAPRATSEPLQARIKLDDGTIKHYIISNYNDEYVYFADEWEQECRINRTTFTMETKYDEYQLTKTSVILIMFTDGTVTSSDGIKSFVRIYK